MRLKITRKSRNIEPSAEPDGGGRARPGRALTAAPRGLGRAVILALGDVLGIVRELVAWPVRLLIGVAELLGRAVLTVWRAAVLPVIRIVYGVASWALRFGEREVTPARTLTVVALAATVALGASQFSDYRAVQVGAPQYSGVENIAPAPEVDQKSPRTAHGVSVFAIAVASLFVTVFAATRNWRLARLLLFLGAAVVLITLIGDASAGLDEGSAGLDYEGANAVLLGGFWAQLFSGVTLMVVGPLLAIQLRSARDARRARGTVARRTGSERLRRSGSGPGMEEPAT